MTYCMSDIHGEYEKFIKMLKVIDLKDDDTLYILGDVLDRGKDPIKTMLKIMEMPNVELLIGNHELMLLELEKKGLERILTSDIADLEEGVLEALMNWVYNGSSPTIEQLRALTPKQQEDVIDHIKNALAYEQLTVNGQKFLLVHAGLMNFDRETDISEYALYEMVWARPDLSEPYFDDVYTVIGHTPTQLVKECDTPGRIFKKNNFIMIDCGCSMGGSLGCLRLDDMKEFYV